MSGDKAFGPTAVLTPANGLTFGRLVAAPVFAVLVAEHGPAAWWLFVAWVALSFSDSLDGRVARWHGTTRSGAFLDPLADKFLVLGALASLAYIGEVSIWPVVLIAAREISMSAYRFYAAKRGVSVPARGLAKLKTLLQDVAVGFAFFPPIGGPHPEVVRVLLWVAVVLTFVSLFGYVSVGRRLVQERAPEQVPNPTAV